MDTAYIFQTDALAYFVLICFALPELIIFAVCYASTFVNVIRRPEQTTNRVLAFVILLLILIIRFIYGSVFAFIIPDDSLPDSFMFIRRCLFFLVAGWWMLVLCLPPLYGIISFIIFGVGNKRLGTEDINYQEQIICILPVYNEDFALLVNGINSILKSDYKKELLEIHVSFDDSNVTD